VALAAERVRTDKTATPAMYLDALKRAGSKRAKGRETTEEYPECFPDAMKLLLDTLLQSDQAHAEDAGKALRKLALLDTEAIPLDLLGADEKKAVLLLQEHSLVTVDDTAWRCTLSHRLWYCVAMHIVTQVVVRDWITSKGGCGARLDYIQGAPGWWPLWRLCWHRSCSSLISTSPRRFPSDFVMPDTPAHWQHARVNGASCQWPGPALLGAAVALTLGRVVQVQTVRCLTILRSCANRQESSLTLSVRGLVRRCACSRRPWIVPWHGTATTSQAGSNLQAASYGNNMLNIGNM